MDVRNLKVGDIYLCKNKALYGVRLLKVIAIDYPDITVKVLKRGNEGNDVGHSWTWNAKQINAPHHIVLSKHNITLAFLDLPLAVSSDGDSWLAETPHTAEGVGLSPEAELSPSEPNE